MRKRFVRITLSIVDENLNLIMDKDGSKALAIERMYPLAAEDSDATADAIEKLSNATLCAAGELELIANQMLRKKS